MSAPSFHILGPLQVYAGGRTVSVGGPKERALLALLLVHPNRVLSVDRLTEELWGDGAPERATAALRVYVSHLRRALGAEGEEVIATRAPGYLLRLAPEQLDATLFETLATEGGAHLREGRAETAAVRLRDALALWRGPALADVADLGFARPEIGRLEELRLGAIEGRVEADLACGRHAELTGELSALVGEHPLRERLWASRILALYRSGRQAEALAAYREVRRILGEEVGLDPGPALVALERAVLARDPSLDWASARNGHAVAARTSAPEAGIDEPVRPPLPAALAAMDASTFVGRGPELSHLEASFARARAGERQVALVAGEPGMGKTALAARVASGLWSEGAVVLFGRCDEESLVPFQPFVEALAHHVEAIPVERLRRLLGERAADLALLLPDLRRRLPELGETVARGADTERYRLFEAVPSFLRLMASESPLLLVLDDLHWADKPTLQLLQHVIRRTVGAPLLVLGTYRDTDLVRTHPMAQTLAELRRANLVDRVLLRGLNAEEVLALVSAGGEADPAERALAAALWRQTEGSPLFLRETLRHLVETGVVRREDGGRWVPRRRIEQLGIPEGVKEVIGRRLTRLSDAANLVLRAGSVMGRSFRLDVLEVVTDRQADALLDALEEAIAAGIVTEVAGSPGRYAFTHALVRDALYDELSLTRRVRMHHRVAEALETLVATDPGPHLAELAYHFGQAAVAAGPERAIDYAHRAGERARRLSAHEEAVRHYAMALEVAEDAGADASVRADLLVAMGRAQWQLGDARPARATFERVVELVGDSDPPRLARAALGYAGAGTPRLFVDVGVRNTRAVHLAERALAGLPAGESALRARLLVRLAALLYFDPATVERRATLSAEAVAIARRLGDPLTLAYVLSDQILATWEPGIDQTALSTADEMLDIARSLGDDDLATLAWGMRTVFLGTTGDIPRFRRALDECTRLSESTKNLIGTQYCELTRASDLALQGHFDAAEALTHKAFRHGSEARDRNAFHLFSAFIFLLRFFQGRLGEVAHIATLGVQLMPLQASYMHSMAAAASAALGMDAEARRHLAVVDPEDSMSVPCNVGWMLALAMQAYACAWLGERGRAAALHRLLIPHAHGNLAIGGPGLGPCAAVLGITAATAGMYEEAERHFTRAVEVSNGNGWRVITAQVQAHHAAMLMARDHQGDRERARSLATEAAAVAGELGLGYVAQTANQVLRALTDGVEECGGDATPMPALTRRDRLRARVAAGGRAAVARLTRGHSDDALSRLFGSRPAQRAVFTAMAAAFQPAMAAGFEGAIVYELTPAEGGTGPDTSEWWTVEVRGGGASAHHRRGDDPAVSLRVSVADLIRLVSGELDPVEAIADMRVIVDGDVLVATRLAEMFGAVEPHALPAFGDGR